jgi:dinuclear metal center YbgI/SA1388 family protein
MKLEEIVRSLDALTPLRYAETWDNVGLLVGDPEANVTRILVTVDYTPGVAAEARERGAELVVSYHPPLFAAVKRIPHDALWAEAVRLGIALYTMHTALDVVAGGTNDVLADACGVLELGREPIRALRPPEPAQLGQGRVGDVPVTTRRTIVARLKEAFALDRVMVAGPLDEPARRVAVAAGAGGELLESAAKAGAEVFVTGEMRHHDAVLAAKRGITCVATLHSNSERAGVRAYATRLAAALPGVAVSTSEADADPFVFV